LAKKGLTVWIFSSLTFFSVAHLIESIYVMITGAQIKLISMYPLIGQKLATINPVTYLWLSAIASISFWGVTCAIAFENPMEQFLNKVLCDAKRQSLAESKMVEDKSEVLDAMYETIESSNATISSVKDLITNVRTEVKWIQPLTTSIDLIRMELTDLTKEVEKLEGSMKYSYVCLACGKTLLPEFKVCPYCGEDAKLLRSSQLTVPDGKLLNSTSLLP
jgi:rRNA maturation endonuclease Nob1